MIHVRAKATAGLSNYSHELLIVSDRATSIGKVDMVKKNGERGSKWANVACHPTACSPNFVITFDPQRSRKHLKL